MVFQPPISLNLAWAGRYLDLKTTNHVLASVNLVGNSLIEVCIKLVSRLGILKRCLGGDLTSYDPRTKNYPEKLDSSRDDVFPVLDDEVYQIGLSNLIPAMLFISMATGETSDLYRRGEQRW